MPEGIIPPFMEDVAQAGGWEEHAKLQAQKELIDTMNKMPPEKFLQLKDMLGSLERMLDVGGSDLGILKGMTDSISDTIQTELKGATAELMNSINTTINTVLEPFMPLIQAGIQSFNTLLSRGINGIEAMITGKFDQYLRSQVEAVQANNANFYYTEQYENAAMIKYQREHPEMYANIPALEASAAAGGVYSGQFDINFEQLAGMLANLELPTFDEEY